MADEVKTYTEEEVQQIKAELEARHNGIMADMRTKHENEVKKLKLNEEERVKLEKEENEKAIADELNSLRAFKKETTISQRLAKENLPSYFKNDSRLLNAQDDKELDSAIKAIKTDFASSLPKGASNSTIVNSSRGETKADKVDGAGFDQALREMAGR